MDSKFDIVDEANTVVGDFTGATYGEAMAYARSLDPAYLVGAHGNPGGPGPKRKVLSSLLWAIIAEHGSHVDGVKSASIVALEEYLALNAM